MGFSIRCWLGRHAWVLGERDPALGRLSRLKGMHCSRCGRPYDWVDFVRDRAVHG